MLKQSAIKAYEKIDVETGVEAANSHKLIIMLLDGALVSIGSAKLAMMSGNTPEKGQLISKAIGIIEGGLRASLDETKGGEIATNLGALYDYMCRQLVLANLRNLPGKLEEVSGLLNEIRSAWLSIKPEEPQKLPEVLAGRVAMSYGKV
ncbi:MAG: flagellar export chaperone FliS [Proteobacteria bacterium]|nr:flagellar export chaperone FliS [Pseudomonadota bacterium]MDE3209075.1 flagellar export chaperone FliS [Pseudomonadota bacterium]